MKLYECLQLFSLEGKDLNRFTYLDVFHRSMFLNWIQCIWCISRTIAQGKLSGLGNMSIVHGHISNHQTLQWNLTLFNRRHQTKHTRHPDWTLFLTVPSIVTSPC